MKPAKKKRKPQTWSLREIATAWDEVRVINHRFGDRVPPWGNVFAVPSQFQTQLRRIAKQRGKK